MDEPKRTEAKMNVLNVGKEDWLRKPLELWMRMKSALQRGCAGRF